MAKATNTCYLNLPKGLASAILSLLPIEDILRCRAVCRDWCELTEHSSFIDQQFKASASQDERVIFIPESSSKIYLLNPREKNVMKISLSTVIHENWSHTSHLRIMGSCHGFLFISSDLSRDLVIVFNPITKARVILPRADPCSIPCSHAVLGYDPSSAKYKMVKVYSDDNFGKCEGQILTLGETSWRPLEFPHGVTPIYWGLPDCYVYPIYCQGGLYWMINEIHQPTGKGLVLFLNLTTEEFCLITFPSNLRLPTYMHFPLSMIKVGNMVHLSQYDQSSMHVWAIKRNEDGEFSIQYFLFLCRTRSFWDGLSLRTLIGRMGNHLLVGTSKDPLLILKDTKHLVLLSPRSGLHFTSQIQRMPQWFRSLTLQPNFVSPPLATENWNSKDLELLSPYAAFAQALSKLELE